MQQWGCNLLHPPRNAPRSPHSGRPRGNFEFPKCRKAQFAYQIDFMASKSTFNFGVKMMIFAALFTICIVLLHYMRDAMTATPPFVICRSVWSFAHGASIESMSASRPIVIHGLRVSTCVGFSALTRTLAERARERSTTATEAKQLCLRMVASSEFSVLDPPCAWSPRPQRTKCRRCPIPLPSPRAGSTSCSAPPAPLPPAQWSQWHQISCPSRPETNR